MTHLYPITTTTVVCVHDQVSCLHAAVEVEGFALGKHLSQSGRAVAGWVPWLLPAR